MPPLIFGPTEHIVLLGSSPLFARLVEWGKDNSVKVTIITSPDQADNLKNLRPIVADKLTVDLRAHVKRAALAISFGARWIMKQKIRQELFYDNVVNCHGTRLPFDRGGGSWSYKAMRNDRLGSLTIHRVDDGIDTGPILAQQTYVVPRHCRTPAELRADYLERLFPFVVRFLERGLRHSATIQPFTTPQYMGTYFPRLHTETHGWIDWTLPGPEIERFILAFDEPYNGALTYWNETIVHLKSCQLHGGETRVHDWQAGTVIRKESDFLVVALRDGWALVVEHITDGSGRNTLQHIAEGDKFSMQPRKRVSVGPLGIADQAIR